MTDKLLETIAIYVTSGPPPSNEALSTARLCFIDAIGCALCAHDCSAILSCGVPLAFQISALIRWLDFNDTWLAAEWGHPSDNLGALMIAAGDRTVRDLLPAMVQAYEIQGKLALANSFNRIGFDHVIFVKIASAAVSAHLLGGSHTQVVAALSNAIVDAGPLRTYRHAPNVGPRKSWAAGDATARGAMLARLALAGDPGCPTALTTPTWGFNDIMLPLTLDEPLSSDVIEQILFKVAYPAEFHGQTAVEAALRLHPHVADRLGEIESIEMATQEAAMRIIVKEGPLQNSADRDHCLQYMVAVALIYGELTPACYEEPIASDPMIETLRSKMVVREEERYTRDYPRTIANRVTIRMKDEAEPYVEEVECPLGHPARRNEGIPLLLEKARANAGEYASALLAPDLLDRPVKEIIGWLNVHNH